MTANWPCVGSGLTYRNSGGVSSGAREPVSTAENVFKVCRAAGRRSIPASASAGSAASISAHRPPEQRVPPVRRDLGERRQHEAALLQPRMRQDQRRRHLAPARRPRGRSSRARSPRPGSTASPLASRSRSQTRGPQRRAAPPAERRLDRVQRREHRLGRQRRGERRGAVDVVRPRPGREGRRAEPAAPRRDRAARAPASARERRLQRRARAAEPPTGGSRRARSGACESRRRSAACDWAFAVARSGI